MNGAEAPDNRVRVLRRDLMFFSGVVLPEPSFGSFGRITPISRIWSGIIHMSGSRRSSFWRMPALVMDANAVWGLLRGRWDRRINLSFVRVADHPPKGRRSFVRLSYPKAPSNHSKLSRYRETANKKETG